MGAKYSMTEIIDPAHAARDCRVVTTAVRRGYPIPLEAMQKIVDVVVELLDDADPRVQVAAGRLFIAMHGQNQKDKPAVKRVKHVHQLQQQPNEPVTEHNLDERKRFLADRLAALGNNAGGSGAG